MAAPDHVHTEAVETPEVVAARNRRRRLRSLALAGALALFALTFYVLTIVKMGPALFDRAM